MLLLASSLRFLLQPTLGCSIPATPLKLHSRVFENSMLSNPVVISLSLCSGASGQHSMKLAFFPFESFSCLELPGPTSPQPVNVRAPAPPSLLCTCYWLVPSLGPYVIYLMLVALRSVYPAQASLLNSIPIYTFGYEISLLNSS